MSVVYLQTPHIYLSFYKSKVITKKRAERSFKHHFNRYWQVFLIVLFQSIALVDFFFFIKNLIGFIKIIYFFLQIFKWQWNNIELKKIKNLY